MIVLTLYLIVSWSLVRTCCYDTFEKRWEVQARYYILAGVIVGFVLVAGLMMNTLLSTLIGVQ